MIQSIWQNKRRKSLPARANTRFVNLLLIFALTMGMFGAIPQVAQAKDDDTRAHPGLLELANLHPDDIFPVIIQRELKNKDMPDDDPEVAVTKVGGKVKKQLKMIESFSAELTGKEIAKLAKNPKIRWITFDSPMVSMAVGDPTVRDDFTTVAYNNNHGTQSWAGNWIETGDDGSASAGNVRIASSQLQLSSTNRTISRQINLSGAILANLSFQYKRSSLDDANDYVSVFVSSNGGSTWTELARFTGPATDSSWKTHTASLLNYAASNTQIRFATSSALGNSDTLYVDNVKIEYAVAPATYVVNHTGDGTDANLADGICQTATAGQCTLRAAIQQANASTGKNIINFNISGAIPHSIQPATALPTISDAVIIDGSSEPDFVSNGSKPVIEINGGNLGTFVNGLVLDAGSNGSTIKGLIINRFTGSGIEIYGSSNLTIQGNWIGLNSTGMAAAANGVNGIYAVNSSNNLIGGTTAATRNVVSGNTEQGIFFDNTDNSTISGNYVGTDVTGAGDVTGVTSNPSQSGLFLAYGASGNIVGGTGDGARNVISGNNHYGFEVIGATSQNNLLLGNYIGTTASGLAALGNTNGGASLWGAGTGNGFGGNTPAARNVIARNGIGILIGNGSIGATVQGNYIGVGADGVTALGNYDAGVLIDSGSLSNTIGGTANEQGNLIANNASVGIAVNDAASFGNALLRNSISNNNGLGIDHYWNGVSANNGVMGSGANKEMDYPVITFASLAGCYLAVTGYVGSAPNQSAFANVRVEFFASAGDSSGYGEGQTYLGTLTTNANGAFGGFLFTNGFTPGSLLTATATGNNNTSEFGPNFQVPALGACVTSPYRKIARTNQVTSTLQGQGMTVAVVDSGISNHADLQGRIIANNNQTSESDAYDNNVHGTHVAGIIAGNGASSDGIHIGIAPQSNLVNVKVSNQQGVAYASDLIDGLQWILNNKAAYNIKVVNISLNSTIAESYHTSPINAAVEILWFNGIVVVVSAGNNGSAAGPSILYPPANDPFVITVGSTEDYGTVAISDDTVAAYSAYGTTVDGFAKPDLVAPGRNVVSLLASTNAYGYVTYPLHRLADNLYFRMSGTSMSAPMVTGAVTLLLQDEPNLTPDQVKYRLMNTANKTWTGYTTAKAGAGYLDIYAAINGTSSGSANTGQAVSLLLTTGSGAVNSTVNWNSVNWNSVNWNSVNWNAVNWNSVNWNATSWGSAVWDTGTVAGAGVEEPQPTETNTDTNADANPETNPDTNNDNNSETTTEETNASNKVFMPLVVR